jgi:GNAT superfamily N-acetyltransferase
LMRVAVERLDGWAPTSTHLEISLPAPLAYGIHDAWPHLATLARDAGFSDADGRTEVQLVTAVDSIGPTETPVEGLVLRRRLHAFGAAFTAILDGREIGLLEVDDDFTRHGSMLRNDGWADISNMQVDKEFRCRGVATWLLGHAAVWLRLGGSRNLIGYLSEDELGSAEHEWYLAKGFVELNRTRRGWTRQP